MSRNSRKTSVSEVPSEYNTGHLDTPSKLALVSSPESQPSPYLSHPSQIQNFQNFHQNSAQNQQIQGAKDREKTRFLERIIDLKQLRINKKSEK